MLRSLYRRINHSGPETDIPWAYQVLINMHLCSTGTGSASENQNVGRVMRIPSLSDNQDYLRICLFGIPSEG